MSSIYWEERFNPRCVRINAEHVIPRTLVPHASLYWMPHVEVVDSFILPNSTNNAQFKEVTVKFAGSGKTKKTREERLRVSQCLGEAIARGEVDSYTFMLKYKSSIINVIVVPLKGERSLEECVEFDTPRDDSTYVTSIKVHVAEFNRFVAQKMRENKCWESELRKYAIMTMDEVSETYCPGVGLAFIFNKYLIHQKRNPAVSPGPETPSTAILSFLTNISSFTSSGSNSSNEIQCGSDGFEV